ncbi:hypothetical protein OS493_009657 [Desmophyllum pertusum]|uniref:Uncharacterized protein n=1 Tax=Desmophyllum pertusum TaxID=174260 RepID=A0A9X0CL84_9CNID|nr:hypothetical protein OS493_009657 [Desmophyllum pertusum]
MTTSSSTSSSTESCKTPVAPRNEVVITMEDDDDDDDVDEEMINVKSQREVLSTLKDTEKEASRNEVAITIEHDYEGESLMLSQYESSSGEVIYTSEKARMDNTTDDAIIDIMTCDDENEETLAVNDNYNDDKLCLTLPLIPPPTASTELRRGKSLIGGRQALENRRFIKHVTSEQDSTGLTSDLEKAISRILGEKKRLVDNNKGKRLVISHQTHETKYSLYESILRAKSLIMDEKVDKERDKRTSLCRHVIKETLSDAYASRPALRPQRTFAREIAFAKEIILKRGRADPWVALRRTKGTRRVQWLDESVNPLDTSASISISNTKGYRKWKNKMKKSKGVKPGAFVLSVEPLRKISALFLPAHYKKPQVGCRCYYCEKHNKKGRGGRFFKLPRFH